MSIGLIGPVIRHPNMLLYGIGNDGVGAPSGIAFFNSVGLHAIEAPSLSILGQPFALPNIGATADQLWWLGAVVLSSVFSPIGATNAMIFLGLTITPMVVYVIVRSRGIVPGASLLGALIYGYCPIRLAEAQEHFLLLDCFWLAIDGVLLLMVARERRTYLALVLGACLGLTELDNPYLGYFGGLLAAVWFAGLLTAALWRRQWSVVYRTGQQGLLALLLLAIVVVPTQLPLLRLPRSAGPAQDGAALVHDLGEVDRLSLRWWNFVLPAPDNPVLGPLGRSTFFAHLGADTVTEQSTSIGYVALALAITAVVVLARRRRQTAPRHERTQRDLALLAAACIGTGVVFGLPPTFGIGPLTVPTPPYFMHALVPEIRTTSRIDLLIQLGVAILAALGAAHLLAAVRSAPRRALITVALAAAVLVEYTNVPPWRSVKLLPAPAFYQWLAQVPAAQAGTVVQYPIVASDMARTPLYAFYAYAVHHHPLFNGVLNDTPPDALRKNLEDVLNPTTPSAWAALGVRTVALDRTFFGPLFGNAGLRWQAGYQRRLPVGLAPAHQDEQWDAYHVSAAPAPVVGGLGAGFDAGALGADGREWHWIGRNATIWLDNVTDRPVLAAVWTEAHNNGGSHALRLDAGTAQPVSAVHAATAVALVAEAQPGFQAFPLAVEGSVAPLAGSGNQMPVGVQMRSLEPAPVTTRSDSFQDGGRATWTLTGVSLDACALQAGAPLDAALLWRADAPTRRDETVFVHLVDAKGALAAQDDGPPNHGAVATSQLGAGSSSTDVHTIQTAGLAPGRYRLLAGLYDRQTGVRLTLPDGADTVELGAVDITPAGAGPQRTSCPW